MKINKISDILPLINEQGISIKEIAKKVGRSEVTIWVWVRKLRQAGFEVKTNPKGRQRLKI